MTEASRRAAASTAPAASITRRPAALLCATFMSTASAECKHSRGTRPPQTAWYIPSSCSTSHAQKGCAGSTANCWAAADCLCVVAGDAGPVVAVAADAAGEIRCSSFAGHANVAFSRINSVA